MRTDRLARAKVPTFRPDRLRYYRIEAGLTQTAAAEAAGVTVGNYGAWERREGFPAPQRLPALAEALGCAIGDLLDPPRTLGDYRHQKGLRQSDLAALVGVSSKTVASWEIHRGAVPASLAPKVADVLGIAVSDLATLGRVDKAWVTTDDDGHVWVGDLLAADPYRVDLTAATGLAGTLLTLYREGTVETAGLLGSEDRFRQEVYADVKQLDALGLATSKMLTDRRGTPLQVEVTDAGRHAAEVLLAERTRAVQK